MEELFNFSRLPVFFFSICRLRASCLGHYTVVVVVLPILAKENLIFLPNKEPVRECWAIWTLLLHHTECTWHQISTFTFRG